MNQLKEPKIGETLNPISALKHIGKRDYHETCFETKKLNIYRGEKQVLKQQSDSPVVYTWPWKYKFYLSTCIPSFH